MPNPSNRHWDCVVNVRYPWKSYRLQPSTVAKLRALRKALERTYLTYDELLSAMISDFLSRRRTLRGEVERQLKQEATAQAMYADGDNPDDEKQG